VQGLRTERTALTGDGSVTGTGVFHSWPVQAVYRCVGYRSTELPGLPWDSRNHVVPHAAGRVLDLDGSPLPGVYVNGWVKRGPVGLIGHTKGDAIETVGSMLEDLPMLPEAAEPAPEAVTEFLDSRGIAYTTWDGWQLLDAHELALGAAHGLVGEQARERVKVVDRQTMIDVSRAVSAVQDGEPGAQQRLEEALEHADEQIDAALEARSG
jgi:ferredoxin--NADP+ reductase